MSVQPDPSPIGSVDKALRVLEELATAGPRGRSLAALSERTGINKPTIHRTLAALRHRGFARQQSADGWYALGATAVRLSAAYHEDDHLPQLLHPALVALCSRTDELVHLGTLLGNQVTYLDKVEPSRSVRVWSTVGRSTPAASTALGRAMIAYHGPDRSSMAWYCAALPAGSTVDETRLWEIMQLTLARGYAVENQENEPGISCLGVPLLRGGVPVAAVSVTAPADRMNAHRLRELARIVPSVLRELLPDGMSLPAELSAG